MLRVITPCQGSFWGHNGLMTRQEYWPWRGGFCRSAVAGQVDRLTSNNSTFAVRNNILIQSWSIINMAADVTLISAHLELKVNFWSHCYLHLPGDREAVMCCWPQSADQLTYRNNGGEGQQLGSHQLPHCELICYHLLVGLHVWLRLWHDTGYRARLGILIWICLLYIISIIINLIQH